MIEFVTTEYRSPIGSLHLVAAGERLCALVFAEHWNEHRARCASDGIAMVPVDDLPWITRRLDRYFAGETAALDDVEVTLSGTAFQQSVWTALRRIRAGETWSYGRLARALGLPTGAARAVGAANGANPVAIVVPCHRVIGETGALTGYAGGLARKRALLVHERALLA